MQFRFIWERIKEKKLAHSIVLIALLIVWLPTLTPDDFIFIPVLIKFLGFKIYLTIALILISLTLIFLNGKFSKVKSLTKNVTESEAERICKKIHSSKEAITECIAKNI